MERLRRYAGYVMTVFLILWGILSLSACQSSVLRPIIHGTVDASSLDSYWTEWNTETFKASVSPEEKTGEETEAWSLKTLVIDVGQGSSLLCESDGEYILVDAGRDASHNQNVTAVLRRLNVPELKLVIATHFDYDHIGQLPGVLENFPVGEMWIAGYSCETDAYQMLMDYIDRYATICNSPACGDSFSFGRATVTVNGPVGGYIYDDENHNSISVTISDGSNVLYCGGDMTAEGEADIIASGADIDSDVYICNHHGSSSSSSEAFLKALSPSYTVISCGRDNDYGHPAKRVLESVSRSGSVLYRTDLQGDIGFVFDGKGNVLFDREPTDDWTPGG